MNHKAGYLLGVTRGIGTLRFLLETMVPGFPAQHGLEAFLYDKLVPGICSDLPSKSYTPENGSRRTAGNPPVKIKEWDQRNPKTSYSGYMYLPFGKA